MIYHDINYYDICAPSITCLPYQYGQLTELAR